MDNQSQLLKQRREKAQTLAEAGVNLFSNDFKKPQPVVEILPLAEALEPETHASDNIVYRVAGRVMSLRKFGKAAFFHVQDESGRMQIYARRDLLGEQFQQFKKWDVGDIVGVEGKLFKTKTGEPSLEASRLYMITKSLRPLPEKFHGLTDVETRYRQRYVDLIVNPEVRDTFRKRMEIIQLIREFLSKRGFMEVETPMMQPVPGGATA
ncbi:MAG: lysine--tRNA ligase, partial [Candidatus Electrothrix sp. AR4]|nr:lysine--tRNA ligase [Candidatus Electrothrix sp. AR4]